MREFWERLLLLDRRYIFILVAISVVVPLLFPLGLPTHVTQRTRDLFTEIENTPVESKAVLLTFDFDPSTYPELYPMSLAILRHCFKKDVRVLLMSLYPQGVGMAQLALEDVLDEFPNKKSGVDYVFLGYRPGFLAVILGLGESIQEVFSNDYYGNDINELSMMAEIHNYDDIEIVVCMTGSAIYQSWVTFAHTRYHVKIGVGSTAVMVTEMYPWLQTEQVVGMLGGLKGAAEYEELLTRKKYTLAVRTATIGMDAQSVVHILMIALVIIGNILYFALRRRSSVR